MFMSLISTRCMLTDVSRPDVFEPAAATLSIHPGRSVFFYYETVTLSCAVPGSFSSWTVKRNTSTRSFVSCETWGQLNGSSCTIKGVYPSDSGVYWCESDSRECSNTINITVTTGVILQGPAVPLTEGDSVTLNCSYKEKYAKESTSNFSAAFYRNGAVIEKTSEGRLSFIHVSKEHEGSYKCEHPTKGQSPEIWLEVRARAPSTTAPPPALMSLPRLAYTIFLFLLFTGILILCISVGKKFTQAETETKMKESDHL
ncbi:Fc receptor-like protein 5 isoform X1 [Simochromis diagramma]|uniref:Fc receptor-like protein 5 isoform X1 n=1 Tax=Simochromis diagramma TaxID=43689 RepID=UPI001A7E4902|nr:Fc receptor-like protein 5 isoform X1 [Simochromis diagramma]